MLEDIKNPAQLNLIIGIDANDFEKAIRALYDEFF